MCCTLYSFSLPTEKRETDTGIFVNSCLNQKNQIIQMHFSDYTFTIILLWWCNNLVQKEINSKDMTSCKKKEKHTENKYNCELPLYRDMTILTLSHSEGQHCISPC